MSTESLFGRWLCEALDTEAAQEAHTHGRLPARPVCLSEVEAMALLVVALESEGRSSFLTGAARRLVARLCWRLDQPWQPAP